MLEWFRRNDHWNNCERRAFTMNFETEITEKSLSFISDVDLRLALFDRLSELDRVFLVNANLSTVFLSVSTIEGIFKHLGEVFKTKITPSIKGYPTDPKGKPKPFKDLTIDELFSLLQAIDILPKTPNFQHVYDLFRNYRNFIHPQNQIKKDWPTGLGQAQMAVGLLNATIDHLSQYLFLGDNLLRRISGQPEVDVSNNLSLRLEYSPTNSFVVFESPVIDKLNISFNLELPLNGVLNFVFNFVNEGSFRMFRLDKRLNTPYRNCLLHCTQKYVWFEHLQTQPSQPPLKDSFPVEIKIDAVSANFDFIVDGQHHTFTDKAGKIVNAFTQFTPKLRIGFFNELLPAKLSNISVSI